MNQSTMNRVLVGEPGVSAFLRSLLRNLGDITRMKSNYIYYDPTQDLEKLREKLVFFQGLVLDGEAKRLDDPGVDEWMNNINDLAYDVEDIFDDIRSLRKDQVSVNYPLLNEFSNDLNSRFIKILARAKKLGKKAKKLTLERVSGHAFRGESKVTLRTCETSSEVDISEIRGREDDKTHIVKRLLEVDGAKGKKKYDVLCIVGMGGIGKTTLAQQVFNAPEVVNHFHVKSWVCISNVFDVARATKQLIEYSRGGGSLGDQSLALLQRRLKEMVGNKRFLFVLDDVWSSPEWEQMKGPLSSCANGSKVLVTTRKIQIAHALGNKDPHQLRELNHEKCVEIFKGKAFGDDEGEQEKMDLVDKIVRACRGVPLLVKVIGSMLRVAADVEKWRAVSENTSIWAKENDEIHPAIKFSYYDLPAYLKRCFEYLALFPPDFRFDQESIVCLWIADGLVEEKEGRMAKDIGAEYYSELKARSLIQENDMMHDIVHYLATVVSKIFCYQKNSKEPPSASVRHAFVVKLNAMHYEFLAQAPCLRTLIVQDVVDENVLRNTIRTCKMLRTLSITWITRTLSLGESFIEHLSHIRYLDIKRSDIRHLPDSPFMLNNLQFLNLSSNEYLENLQDRVNHLSSLSKSICTLSQLQVLNLSYCGRLKELPEDIGTLRSLQTLDLCRTSISSLPESICALSQLQVLNLRHTDIKELPEDIGTLRCLRTLDLSKSSISSFPESICALSQLQVLNLKGCRNLNQLPKDIGNLKRLPTLHLSFASIASLPESICALSQLQVLILRNCWRLIQLPKDIGNLKSLSTLDLSSAFISSLPESICALSKLQVLQLDHGCNLVQLPKDIGNLNNLRTLDLSFGSISSLPESICALSQLRVLNIRGCRNLMQLPKDIGNLKSLPKLDLTSASISSLPESICALSQLQVLNLDHCRNLIHLPEDIGNLKSLSTLDLSLTSISSLPESICALSQLQILNLQGCRNLIQLPKDIGNLRRLQTLNLRNASILSVPESIINVGGLQHLLVDKQKQLPLHIGQLARLKELTYYHVGMEEGRGLGELNLMNMLEGSLTIGSMENIGGVEEAKMADLKSKKNVRKLAFEWSKPGNDEEMEVKIMEALEPHHELESLTFCNYGGDKFPAWIMPSNVCFSNLRWLRIEGLNKIRDMIDMEFVSLDDFTIENCPKLRKVLLVAPKLKKLYTRKCGELEAASVYLLPSMSDKAALHFILSQLTDLECSYTIFEYFCEKLKTTNSKWDKLQCIELSGRGTEVASLPVGWPSIMVSPQRMAIREIKQGKFQFVPDGDQSEFPRSLRYLYINDCEIKERLPHHSYTITADGKVESEG